MHGLRELFKITQQLKQIANISTKINQNNKTRSKRYKPNNIINEQTATLDNNAINQAATTVNTTKAALHGDVKLQNDKDHAETNS